MSKNLSRSSSGDDSGSDTLDEPRPRRTILRRVVLAVGLGLSTMVVIALALAVWGVDRLNEITYVEVPGVAPAPDGQPANWLLVGTDGREGIGIDDPNAGAFLGETVEGKRTDTILLVRVDPAGPTVDMLSVPRDLWVTIADGEAEGRINGAYNGEDGRRRLVTTIERSLSIEVNHYAEVNFVGFQHIVDALNGVPVWFDHPTRDSGSGLNIPQAGCHVLDGSQALAFARGRTFEQFRDDAWQLDPTGDIGRTARQRLFLTRLVDTASDSLSFTNLGTLDEVLKVAGQNLVVDDGADAIDLVALGRSVSAVGPDAIVGHALPVDDFVTDGGAQVLRLRREDAQPVLDVFRTGRAAPSPDRFGPADDQPPQQSVTVTVVPPADAEQSPDPSNPPSPAGAILTDEGRCA